jgi:hypothetical protein
MWNTLKVVSLALLIAVPAVQAQAPAKKKEPPRLVPIAETRLLMEGLAHPDFQGLEKILSGDGKDKESWEFGRGQSILLAETANLLMLRPPRNTGQDAWMQHASKFRDAATDLARIMARQDREAGRAGLVALSAQCNSCHQTFRIATKITAFSTMDSRPPSRNP